MAGMLRTDHLKEILRGAAVAAVLILPSLLQQVPPAMAGAAGSSDWTRWPVKTFDAHSVRLEDVVANIAVDVAPGPIRVEISGNSARLQKVTVKQDGDSVLIEGPSHRDVWNWNNWFDFSRMGENPQSLWMKVTVPQGTPVTVDGLVGNARVGDTMGPLHFDVVSSRSQIGRVKEAKISLSGSGDIQIAEVAGKLSLDVAGSGKIAAGRTGPVNADLAGAGDVALGDVDGGLKLDIAGSGDFAARSVNGPVHVSIAGSGSVKIADGKADPLHLSIMGSGNFDFGGVAVDPHLSALGSGQVRLKSYTGNLSTSGNVSLKVNGQSVHTRSGDDDDDDD